MKADVAPADGNRRPDSPAQRIDAACDRFEAAWRAGLGPRIEDDLARADESDRPALLRELLALELELRRAGGEGFTPGEYRDRFPGQADLIDAAFALAAPGPGRTRPRTNQALADTGRNLLFGLLALQNNFVSREALLGAFAIWVADKARPLGRILRDRGALDDGRHALLEALVAEHLKLHGNDPDRSLAALSSIGSVREDLSRIADPDLDASLNQVSAARGDDSDRFRTVGQESLGASTSAGSRFRVLRPHARGGLGQVSVALDQELDRPVALKEIQDRHADDPHSRARFVQEAEITGKLEHPGIIPVYGLGHDPTGRPFYAMRFIQGDSLKEAIAAFHGDEGLKKNSARRASRLRELLRRFTDVCNAVAYAHSRGVLHRDLKPGNIMLGPYGETLVVDWGLAKPLGRATSAEPACGDVSALAEGPIRLSGLSGSRDETVAGSIVGTPAYASPEQIAGRLDLLGPASDVYGLGATLYALMTGRAPVELGEIEEILRRVRRGEVPPPRSIDPSIPKPLEAICRKAMELKAEDRYASARELAQDITRWMDDAPVAVYREPVTVRAGRWMRRHRTLVSGATIAVSIATVALGVSTLLLGRANEAVRAQEQTARDNLHASRRFVAGMLKTVVAKLPDVKGMDEVQRQILQDALKFYSEFVLERSRDPETRHEVGRAYQEIAVIRDRLGQVAEVEAAYREGLAVLESLTAEYPAVPEYRRSLSALLANLGSSYRERKQPAEAETALRRAVAIEEGLDGGPTAPPNDRRALAHRHFSLAMFYHQYDKPVDAERSYREALAIQEALVAADPQEHQSLSELSQTLYELGYLIDQRVEGGLKEALPMYERLVGIQEELVRASPASAKYRGALTSSLSYLGAMYSRDGRMADAEKVHLRTIAFQKALTEDHPDVPAYLFNLSLAYVNLGNYWRQSARPDEAERWHQAALRIAERVSKSDPDEVNYALSAAQDLGQVGKDRSDQGRNEEAVEWYGRSLRSLEAIYRATPNHASSRRRVSTVLVARAESLHKLGRDWEALSDLRRAAELDVDNNRDLIRSLRARVQAKSIDPAGAAAEAAALEASASGEVLYNAAATYALLPSTGGDAAGLSASRAVSILSRARVNGYFSTPAEIARLANDCDMNALRRWSEFQGLTADLSFPADPFAR